MKKFLAVSAVAMLAVVGCGGKGKTTSSTGNASGTSLVTPPPPPVISDPQQPPVTKAESTGTTEAQPASGRAYTVKKGDTLWSIATKTYGDGKQWKKIASANPSIKGDKVSAGQTITLP